jgi:3'-phosphoadenosine 5'-phosphosulfate (PAPS) 3'-phosphatase
MHRITSILTEAVLAGAAEVLRVRRGGAIDAGYKDATELVTEADRRSDAAMLAVLQARFPAVDPAISFELEESGVTGTPGAKRVGADPLDGTTHFAAGGNQYSVMAHYIEDGVPLVGVVFQPEIYLPLAITDAPSGRLASAVRGGGATMCRTEFVDGAFRLGPAQPLVKRASSPRRTYLACVPITAKMGDAERALMRKVHDSGLIAGMTGTGNAGGNVMMTILGGQDVYMNLGAGVDLDLVPPQVIALEAGLTVWGSDRKPPVWHVRKQPFIVALDDETAEKFLTAAGL